MLFLTLMLSGCLVNKTREAEPVPPAPVTEEAPETSLPAPDESDALVVEPPQEPSPPEISYYEAIRQISRLYPDGLQPLTIRGRIQILLHDLDSDRNPECFSLGIPSHGLDPQEAARLDDTSRLFQEDSTAVDFSLLLFANHQGNFHCLKVLPLGERMVFELLRKTSLYTNKTLPVIISVAFQTLEGRELELLVFDKANGLPRARRSLAETLATKSRLEDIDGNGVIDLFVKERAMEEGTGFETFLTWYRWNGRDFVEYKTQNVVRNLNAFLLNAKELMLAGQLQEAVRLLVDPAAVKALRKKGCGNEEILIRTLGLEELGVEEFPPLREVIFPQVLEDPFTTEDQQGMYFAITYRMIDTNGTSYIANARLYMLHNPFRERQFAFAPTFD